MSRFEGIKEPPTPLSQRAGGLVARPDALVLPGERPGESLFVLLVQEVDVDVRGGLGLGRLPRF